MLTLKSNNITKDLIKKISLVEKEIELLDKKEKQLERFLVEPDIYKDPKKVSELNEEFNNVKLKLSEKLKMWENLNSELQDIESEFK